MSPLEEYRSRQGKWGAQRLAAQRTFITIGNFRLTIAVAAALLAYLAFGRDMVSAWWLLAPLAVFVGLIVWHQRVLRERTFAERAVRFYDQGMDRLQDRWQGRGRQGERFRDPEHVYSEDLDIFGRGSLFELVSVARTAAGERTLADWLLTPADASAALERQGSVIELSPKVSLREEMALLGEEISAAVDAVSLEAWGIAPPVPFPTMFRLAALALSLLGLAAVILKWASVWPIWPLLTVLGVNCALLFLYRRQTRRVHAGIETSAHNLGLLSLLIDRLERETFESPGLKRLRLALATEGVPASRRIKQLGRWLDLLDSSDHVLLRVLDPVILYKQQIVAAIEAWRARSGASIGKWIHALAEFEVLSSFASLHYERPLWCFPLLTEGPPRFSAVELGHPLLPDTVNVRNTVTLDSECRLLIVSGSNMSGKSTLLRAVGVNTVLAWAGAPVCASGLQISVLHTGASLRVSDSLQDNRSRFFAEINRLRQIVDLTQNGLPVLFLLDELLSGTNSHDRRIGAAGIVRGLLAANTVGLLTTHDLALAQLDQDAGANIRNVHFEDKILDGKIEFDYRLRPGVVTHSNALELMRSIGLKI